MVKRFLFIALLLIAAARAEAFEYTDVYFTPGEPGWGVFLVQSDNVQFLAFFIYGSDGNPIWYSAQLKDDGTGNYIGTLYATTGTYFDDMWQGYNIDPVGTASFQPIDRYRATLTYKVKSLGTTTTKTIQRQTLTAYVLGGNYTGSMAGSISGCTDPTANDAAFRATYALTVQQVGDQSVYMNFTFVDNKHSGIVCTVSGPLTHLGRHYQVTNGHSSCTGPGVILGVNAVTIDGLHPTDQGIEGYWTGSLGGACTASLHFAAVLNVNN